MSTHTALDIATGLVIFAAFCAWGFCIHYTVVANWWRSYAGRQMFVMVGSLALLLTLVLIHRFVGYFPGYLPLALVFYAAVAASLASVWVLLIKRQNRRNK